MESLLYQVIRILNSVEDADRYGSLRQRYATELQWKEESVFLEDHAMEQWFLAKRIICENKEQLDREFQEEMMKAEAGWSPYLGTYSAAVKVIEKELNQEAEKALTSEE